MPHDESSTTARKPRHKFSPADCQLGYRRAYEKAMQSWEMLSWFTRRVRNSYYRKGKSNGQA